MKVAILGSTGMLGSMVRRYLSTQPGYDPTCPSRYCYLPDATTATPAYLFGLLQGHDYCINCIGLIKPRIDESSPRSVRDAIQVNALFPHMLAQAAERSKCRVIQIATDCVYSGTGQSAGVHDELSPHDPLDIYGKTKSLGEVVSPNVYHLRCSIVGPEQAGRAKDSLLEWFLGQPQGATVKGYTNHLWNGITTLAFARLCHGIMRVGLWDNLPPVQHVVPLAPVTKARLLSDFACFYNREDVSIGKIAAPIAVDRTLTTIYPEVNSALWLAADYASRPSIGELVAELAAYQ
jgi:dTDP-4-dehydrorhamnose reductase